MSDDTPTQRFDAAGDGGAGAGGTGEPVAGNDASTELLSQHESHDQHAHRDEPTEDEKKSKRLIIILASVGGALLIALIIILILLFGSGQPAPTPTGSPTATPTRSATPIPTPTTSPTPTPTPTPSPTQTVDPPPPTGPVINSFSMGGTTVECAEPGTEDPSLDISWSASRVDQVFFGIDTTDASAAPFFSNLAPSGDASDFPAGYDPFKYSCPAASHVYTITVIGGGDKVSQSITVTNTGYTG